MGYHRGSRTRQLEHGVNLVGVVYHRCSVRTGQMVAYVGGPTIVRGRDVDGSPCGSPLYRCETKDQGRLRTTIAIPR
jgi:hypothetical protein